MGDEERDDIIDDDEEVSSAEDVPSGGVETSKIVKILLYGAFGILLIVLVTGISYLVAKHVQEGRYERRQDIVSAPPPDPLSSFELQDFAKTTADAEPHFIKMKISLAYDQSVALNNELLKRKDQMRHIINIILQGKKYEDLDSVSDAVALAEDIKSHINVILQSGKIKEVYFKDLVVN